MPNKSKNKNTKKVVSKINKRKKELDTKDKILIISFAILLILVIILTFVAVNKKKEYDKKQSTDIIMPILEKKVNNTFNIDISKLKENDQKSYSFKITNYKDKKTSTSKISYKISIDTKENDIELKIYKNKDDKNLFKDLEKYEITGKLSKNEKQEDTYTLIVKANKEIEKNKTIEVKIAS